MIHYTSGGNNYSINGPKLAIFKLDSNLMTNVSSKARLSLKQFFRKVEVGMIKY